MSFSSKPPLHLRVLIPGLCGRASADSLMPCVQCPPLPALATLIARAQKLVVSANGFEETLCQLAAISHKGDLPIAPLTLLGDGINPEARWWLRVDPVYLRADQHKLLLFHPRSLNINDAELLQWYAELQPTFAQWGCELLIVTAERWYLGLAENPQISTSPLPQLIGQGIACALPQGPNAKIWRIRFNELQMLLHASPINRLREQRGQPTLNSLWFWGAGVLPNVALPWQYIWTNEALGRGIAIKAKIEFSTVPDSGDALLDSAASGDCVVVLEHTTVAAQDNEPQAWLAALQRLDSDWFAPLLKGLKQGKLASLAIYPCDGRVLHLVRGGIWRFWRRPQAVGQFLFDKEH